MTERVKADRPCCVFYQQGKAEAVGETPTEAVATIKC